MLEQLVKECGFENEKEFYKLIASIDISTVDKQIAFKKWQEEDGTKAGLAQLRDSQSV